MESNVILFLLIIIYFILVIVIEIFFTDMNTYVVAVTLVFLITIVFYFWLLQRKRNMYKTLEEITSSQLDTTPIITSNMICRKIREKK